MNGAAVRVLKPTTPREASDAFLTSLKRKGRATTTLTRYAPILDAFVEWADDRPLHELNAAEIDFGFFEWWSDQFEVRNSREPTLQSLRAVHTVLSSLFRFLTNYAFLVDAEGRAVPNPMLAIEPPKVTRRRNDWLRRAEDQALLETPMDALEELLIWLFRWTGLRLNEALTLRIRDIDLDNRTLLVSDSKTEHGIREVPIVPELVLRIRARLAFLDEKGLNRPNGYLLCTTRRGHWRDPVTGCTRTSEPGGPMKAQQVEKIVRRVGERVGISRLTPHRLRRTFGSFFLNADVRLETVSNLMGHADTRITQQSYAQLMPKTARREMLEAVGM
jgi:integrase